MARKMDPKAAADEIRSKVGKAEALSPEARHSFDYVRQVCHELSIPVDVPNVLLVHKLLRDADIQPHLMQEYPKWIMVQGDDGEDQPVLVNDADEERKVQLGGDPAETPEQRQQRERFDQKPPASPEAQRQATQTAQDQNKNLSDVQTGRMDNVHGDATADQDKSADPAKLEQAGKDALQQSQRDRLAEQGMDFTGEGNTKRDPPPQTGGNG